MKIWTFGALQKYFRLTCRYLRSECLLCNFDWLCLASNQISSFAKRHKLGVDIFFDKLVANISMEMPPRFFLQPTIRVIKRAHRMCSSDHDRNCWWTSLFMNTLLMANIIIAINIITIVTLLMIMHSQEHTIKTIRRWITITAANGLTYIKTPQSKPLLCSRQYSEI